LGVQTPSLPIFISVSRLAATLVARVGGGINGWLPFKIYIYIYIYKKKNLLIYEGSAVLMGGRAR
jgi:hypothetical protein